MSEIIGYSAYDPFDAFVNSVSQIMGVVERCGAFKQRADFPLGLSDRHEDQCGCLCW